MFTEALFIINKTKKQPKCPQQMTRQRRYVHTHTHTHTYIYTMEYYSAIKRNEITPFAAIQMDLEITILSEVSQTEKDKYMISLICGI